MASSRGSTSRPGGGGAVCGDVDRHPAAAAGGTVRPGAGHQAARSVDARAAVLGDEFCRVHRAAVERRRRLSADRTAWRPRVVDQRHPDVRPIEQVAARSRRAARHGRRGRQHDVVPARRGAVSILMRRVLPVLARYLAATFVAGIVALVVAWRSLRSSSAEPPPVSNPLQLRNAHRAGADLPGRAVRRVLRARLGGRQRSAGQRFHRRPDRRRCVDDVDDAERRQRMTIEAASRAILIGRDRQLDHESRDRVWDWQGAVRLAGGRWRWIAMAAAGAAAFLLL